jgi:hypothetical protein
MHASRFSSHYGSERVNLRGLYIYGGEITWQCGAFESVCTAGGDGRVLLLLLRNNLREGRNLATYRQTDIHQGWSFDEHENCVQKGRIEWELLL